MKAVRNLKTVTGGEKPAGKRIAQTAVFGIVTNAALFVLKLMIGFMSGSVAITADSVNNLSDCGSGAVMLIGQKLADNPADAEHPFGHGRIEYISGLVIAFLVLLLGYEFAKQSFLKIINPAASEVSALGIVLLTCAVAVKVWQCFVYRKTGKAVNSPVLTAGAVDSRNDAIITSFTILSAVVAQTAGIIIDGYAGMVISAFLLYSGVQLVKDTLRPIIGAPADSRLAARIEKTVELHSGILATHDLIIHNYGPRKSFATIHIEIPDTDNLQKAHTLADAIEKKVYEETGVVLTVHTDPVNLADERILRIVPAVVRVLESYPGKDRLSAHDFRIIDGNESSKCFFDVVVPHKYPKESLKLLTGEIKKAVNEIEPEVICCVNIENGYIGSKE